MKPMPAEWERKTSRKTLPEGVTVAYLVGFLPAEDLGKLQAMARENAWGLLAEDPTEEDDAPTKPAE